LLPWQTRVAEEENNFRLTHKGFGFVLFSHWHQRPPLGVFFPEMQRFGLISSVFEARHEAKRNETCMRSRMAEMFATESVSQTLSPSPVHPPFPPSPLNPLINLMGSQDESNMLYLKKI